MQTAIFLHAILMALLSSCSVPCLALHVHVPTCESRRRSWVGGARKDTIFPCIVVSSSANDENNGGDTDTNMDSNGGGLTPLFPELISPDPLQAPQSYDDAADALQNRRRGPPSSSGGQSGERALSTSEEIRNALEGDGGGGLAAAAMAIRKAMSPGGDWYNTADGGDKDDVAVERKRDKILDFLLGEDADTNVDRAVPDEKDELGSSSQLTNLDYLLGKIGERKDES